MITGGDIVLPGGDVVPGGTLLIKRDRIAEILDKAPASLLFKEESVAVVDATGHWVTPGLIDQHLHGAFGVDFNQSSTEDMLHLFGELPRHGITSLLPTLISAPKLEMVTALTRLEEAMHLSGLPGARLLGIHLEGPFLNREFRGAHPVEDLLPLNERHLDDLLSPSVKRLTLAPELDPDCRFISRLAEQGFKCSVGHSGADYQTAMKSFQAGANCATHLFNAMAPLHHRKPSLLAAALLHDEVFVELIADGKHLSPTTVAMTLRLKPQDKPILISDCNALTGMAPGSARQFGRQTIRVDENQVAVNEEGRLAGGTDLVTDCVRNLVAWGVLPFPKAVQLATYNPALHLDEAAQVGQLAPHALADVVLWRQADLSIESVFMSGQCVFSAESQPPVSVG